MHRDSATPLWREFKRGLQRKKIAVKSLSRKQLFLSGYVWGEGAIYIRCKKEITRAMTLIEGIEQVDTMESNDPIQFR
mgnify:FL=1